MASKEQRSKEVLLLETPSSARTLLQRNIKADDASRTESCTILSQLKKLSLVLEKNVRNSEGMEKQRNQKTKKVKEDKFFCKGVKNENK